MSAQVQREITATQEHADLVKEIVDSAIRLKSDINGNPRYYISAMDFSTKNGVRFRPAHANKYRGRQFAAGWTFQSYNLKRSVEIAIENQYGVQF